MRCYRCRDRKGPFVRIDCQDVCTRCQKLIVQCTWNDPKYRETWVDEVKAMWEKSGDDVLRTDDRLPKSENR